MLLMWGLTLLLWGRATSDQQRETKDELCSHKPDSRATSSEPESDEAVWWETRRRMKLKAWWRCEWTGEDGGQKEQLLLGWNDGKETKNSLQWTSCLLSFDSPLLPLPFSPPSPTPSLLFHPRPAFLLLLPSTFPRSARVQAGPLLSRISPPC